MLLAVIMEGKAEDGLNTGPCGATFDPDRRRSHPAFASPCRWVQAAHDKIEALERVIAELDGDREAALAGFLRTLASTPLGNRSTLPTLIADTQALAGAPMSSSDRRRLHRRRRVRPTTVMEEAS
jgi:hypothetical protein